MAYRRGGFSGIGFVLGDGRACIDLDKCRDKHTCARHPDAQGAIQRLLDAGYYVDISPSGTGYKAFGRATRYGGEVKFHVTPAAHVTWATHRYCAVTGHGHGDPTLDLSALIDEWFPPKTSGPLALLTDAPAFITQGDTRGKELMER